MSLILSIYTFLAVFICFYPKNIDTQAPFPTWDPETKGIFFLRANETINYFTNNWPLSDASTARQSAHGPHASEMSSGATSRQTKNEMLDMLKVGSPSASFLDRVQMAADQCQVYMDYDFVIDSSGSIRYRGVAFFKIPTEADKFTYFATRGLLACKEGTDDCKQFLQCVFDEMSKRGDITKCAKSNFPSSAANNFKNCALNKVAANFMLDLQQNKDQIDDGVKTYGPYAKGYQPAPKCSLWSDDVKPFVLSPCPEKDNQAWYICGGEKPPPSSSPLSQNMPSALCFGLTNLLIVYVIKAIFNF